MADNIMFVDLIREISDLSSDLIFKKQLEEQRKIQNSVQEFVNMILVDSKNPKSVIGRKILKAAQRGQYIVKIKPSIFTFGLGKKMDLWMYGFNNVHLANQIFQEMKIPNDFRYYIRSYDYRDPALIISWKSKN